MLYLCTKFNQMTKETFINSGRITDLKNFVNLYPKEQLESDTTDVVVYKDGHYIQMLKTGMYFYDGYQHCTLEAMEEKLWKKIDEN